MGFNVLNSKVFGVSRDFQRAYTVYAYFIHSDIDCEIKSSVSTSILWYRYLGQNVILPHSDRSDVLFTIRVKRRNFSLAEKVYKELPDPVYTGVAVAQ